MQDIFAQLKVLVVDDFQATRKLAINILIGLGFDSEKMVEAKNGRQALDLLNAASDEGWPFGLVLSDILMPEMTGIELLKAVRGNERLCEVPFLILSAEDNKATLLEAIRFGVSEYAIKPPEKASLLRKLEKILKPENKPPKILERVQVSVQPKPNTVLKKDKPAGKTETPANVSLEDTYYEAYVLQDRILNMMSDALVVVNGDGKVIKVNRCMSQLSGFSRDELVGCSLSQVLEEPSEEERLSLWDSKNREGESEPNSLDYSVEKLRNLIPQGKLKDRESLVLVKGGEKILTMVTGDVLEKGESGAEILLIIRDARSLKYVNDLREAHQVLVNAAKFVAIGEMASGIAHEINNPLAIIYGYVERLEECLESGDLDKEVLREALETIQTTAMRISKIIKSLKTVSRADVGDPFEPVTVSELLKNALDLCGKNISTEGIKLTVKQPEESLTIECQPVQMTQVLVNLLNNSMDAIKDLDPKWVVLEVVEEGDMVRFSVTDCGGGIPPDIREQIMDPFFTTKGSQGTGFGLSLSKSTLEKHGGILKIDSECPNTKFTFSLPKTQISNSLKPRDVSKNKMGEESLGVHNSQSFLNKCVLFVDDEPKLRELVEYWLRKGGFQVRLAKSGNEGFAMYQEKKPDILVTDIKMPNGTGIDLLKKIKAFDPNPPPLVVVSGSINVDQAELQLLEIDKFIQKPVQRKSLMDVLKNLLSE